MCYFMQRFTVLCSAKDKKRTGLARLRDKLKGSSTAGGVVTATKRSIVDNARLAKTDFPAQMGQEHSRGRVPQSAVSGPVGDSGRSWALRISLRRDTYGGRSRCWQY